MLAVAVERDDRVEALLERPAEPGPERGALALVGPLDQDIRTGAFGERGGGIRRAIVDDENRQVGERAASRLAEMCEVVVMTGADRRRPAA